MKSLKFNSTECKRCSESPTRKRSRQCRAPADHVPTSNFHSSPTTSIFWAFARVLNSLYRNGGPPRTPWKRRDCSSCATRAAKEGPGPIRQHSTDTMIHDGDASKRKADAYALEMSPNGSCDTTVPVSPPSPQLKAAAEKDMSGLMAAAAHAAVPTWATMVLMVSLIFGGCCANVSVLD